MGYMIIGMALSGLGLVLALAALYAVQRVERERAAWLRADLRSWTGTNRRLEDRIKALSEAAEGSAGNLNEIRMAVRYLEDRGKDFSQAMERCAGEMQTSALTGEELRRGMEILLKRERIIDEHLERVEKMLSARGAADQAGPTDRSAMTETPIPAEREAEMSREMEEGVMNLLRYAAGKVPGVEVQI